jgi:transcriptional regulator with XRE-family HTH domain
MENLAPVQIDRKDVSISFGEWIIEARRRSGLTQIDVSKGANITQAALSRIESGINNPSLDMAIRLCNVLGLDLTEFTAQYTDKTTPQP